MGTDRKYADILNRKAKIFRKVGATRVPIEISATESPGTSLDEYVYRRIIQVGTRSALVL